MAFRERRADAERFIEEVRGDEPELAVQLRIEGARVGRGWGETRHRVFLDPRASRCAVPTPSFLPGEISELSRSSRAVSRPSRVR